MSRQFSHTILFAILLIAGTCARASASPTTAPWNVDGPDDSVAVAAAAVSGWYAVADSYEDNVEIRDIRGNLVRLITAAQIQALAPWMTFTGGPDGPAALAFTDSGRNLFILVTDSSIPGDGLGSDVILRYDAPSDSLSLFARLEAASSEAAFPHLSIAHFRAGLYVGTPSGMMVFSANANDTSGFFITTIPLPDAGVVRGLAIDRDNLRIYAASPTNLYRSNLSPISWTLVGAVGGTAGSEARAIAWADHFGNPNGSQRGLYVLRDSPGGAAPFDIRFVPALQAQGSLTYAPSTYTSSATAWHDLCAAPDGSLLVAADEDAVSLTDSLDTRLTFDAWVQDEFNQHIALARGLISPDGEPTGWVIDGDVIPSWSRFHPATPDAAGWTIFALLAADRVNADASAKDQIRSILNRYAGLAATGPAPLRTADGIFTHWIDPATGSTKSGWGVEYATLSTMKIVAGAARAMRAYPDDPEIVRAAARIIFNTKNWSTYTPSLTVNGFDGLYFLGSLAGGTSGSRSNPYNEGIIFVEQSGVYGGTNGSSANSRWFTRDLWPTATYLAGRSVTGDAGNSFQSAFLTMYPMLLSKDFRASPSWQSQVQNLRWSHAAWTDNTGTQYYTVFSAGTGQSDWNGGYNADSISSHPGDVTTFTSLLALGAQNTGPNRLAEVIAGYHAYRKGARQTFKTGASLLYRRSNAVRTFTPNSCGLPDVTIGGLGLAEVLSPGFIDSTLAVPYPTQEQCPVDLSGDGLIDEEDLYTLYTSPQDISGNGLINLGDVQCLINWLRRSEPAATTGRVP